MHKQDFRSRVQFRDSGPDTTAVKRGGSVRVE